MNIKSINFFLCILFYIPIAEAAVSEEDFNVKTTQNLLNLCAASSDDPQYKHAIHFCHGYMLGSYHYHASAFVGSLVCFPEPRPSRNEAVEKVTLWFQKHPKYMSELPVETQFRALVDLWPCKK